MRRPKKSKYKSVVIKKKRYYFYKITWLDITGDSGHADLHTAEGFMPSVMVTHAYLLNKDNKNVGTFASYEANDELFSDRNVCLLYTSPSPRDRQKSRMPSSA